MGATPALTPAFPALAVTSLWNFPQFHSSHTLSAAFSTPWSAHLPIPSRLCYSTCGSLLGPGARGRGEHLDTRRGRGCVSLGTPWLASSGVSTPGPPLPTAWLPLPGRHPLGTWPPHCPALAPTGGLGFGPSRGWAIWAFCYPLVSRWSQGPTPGLA